MFLKAPETKALFGYTDVDGIATLRLRAQGSRIWDGVKQLVGLLDTEGVLQESLKHWRDQHAVRHLKPEYYKVGNDWIDHKSNEVTE